MNSVPASLLPTVSLISVLLLLMVPQAKGQTVQIPHENYMEAINLKEDHFVMQNILLHSLQIREPGRSVEYYRQNASFFSMILLLSGISPRHVYLLEDAGVDLVHAITAENRPFTEQSLLADLVISGTVMKTEHYDGIDDGFDYLVTVRIDEILKGSAPRDIIYIRQRSHARLADSETRPEPNRQYLFFLSSGVYGYQASNHRLQEYGQADVAAPISGSEDTFVIYRMYEIRDGDVFPSNSSLSVIRRELEKIDSIIHGKE